MYKALIKSKRTGRTSDTSLLCPQLLANVEAACVELLALEVLLVVEVMFFADVVGEDPPKLAEEVAMVFELLVLEGLLFEEADVLVLVLVLARP